MLQWVQVVACSFIACKLNKNIGLLLFLPVYLDVDFEKDIVFCEVPFGGVLFINNLVPHRRYVFSCVCLFVCFCSFFFNLFISVQFFVSYGLEESPDFGFPKHLSTRWFVRWYAGTRSVLSPGQTIATFQRNISQHCWTQRVRRVWLPCCDVLRHVGCCWLKFENGQTFHATFANVAWCCTRLARFVQQCCARACALVRFSTPTKSQHVHTRRNRVAKCTQHVAHACCAICCAVCTICCVKMLRSFANAGGLQMLDQRCCDMLCWNVAIVWPGLYRLLVESLRNHVGYAVLKPSLAQFLYVGTSFSSKWKYWYLTVVAYVVLQKTKYVIFLSCFVSQFGELFGQDSMEHGSEVAKTG